MRIQKSQRFRTLKRRASYNLLGRQISVNISHIVSGFIYIVFGLFILVYQRTNPDAFTSSYQVEINLWAAQVTRFIKNATTSIPDGLWAFVFAALFLAIGWLAYRQAKNEVNEEEEKK